MKTITRKIGAAIMAIVSMGVLAAPSFAQTTGGGTEVPMPDYTASLTALGPEIGILVLVVAGLVLAGTAAFASLKFGTKWVKKVFSGS